MQHLVKEPPTAQLSWYSRAAAVLTRADTEAPHVVLAALSLALVAALLEGLTDWVYSALPDLTERFGFLMPDILWIVAAWYLAVFGVVAALFLLSRPLWRRHGRPGVAAYGVFTALAVFVVLIRWKEIHPVAVLLLSLGIGVQAGRLLGPRAVAAGPAAARRTFLRLLGVNALVVLAGRWAGPTPEAPFGRLDDTVSDLSSLLSLGTSRRGFVSAGLLQTAASPPNVVLLVLDTVRADHLSMMGYGRPTSPTIDSLASEAVVFDLAVAPASWTRPSHASMFTGRAVNEHKAWKNALDSRFPTLAEFLRDRGFATGGFVGNTRNTTQGTGLSRGFSTYQDYFGTIVDTATHTSLGYAASRAMLELGDPQLLGRKRAAGVNTEFRSWLSAQGGSPFFAFLNFFDAHAPYMPPAPYDQAFPVLPSEHRHRLSNFQFEEDWETFTPPANELRYETSQYDGAVQYMDAQVASLVETLRAANVLDRTLLIVTADHGEEFGDHRQGGKPYFGHGQTLYLGVLQVPLLVRLPGAVPAARRVACAASLQSIPSTVVDLLGVGKVSPFSIESLSAHWAHEDGQTCDQDAALSEDIDVDTNFAMKSITTSKWHFIVNKGRQNELFSLGSDRAELEDVSRTDEGVDLRRQLSEQMAGLMPPDVWSRFARFTESHR